MLQNRHLTNSTSESEAAAKRSYHTSEVRGGDREEQPHLQGAAAAQAQEV